MDMLYSLMWRKLFFLDLGAWYGAALENVWRMGHQRSQISEMAANLTVDTKRRSLLLISSNPRVSRFFLLFFSIFFPLPLHIRIHIMMFGPGSVALGPSQQRLLDGTIDLGFPEAGMFVTLPHPALHLPLRGVYGEQIRRTKYDLMA